MNSTKGTSWGEFYVPFICLHARWELLQAIQVSLVSLVIHVTSVTHSKFPLFVHSTKLWHTSASVLISSNGSWDIGSSHMTMAKEKTSHAGVMTPPAPTLPFLAPGLLLHTSPSSSDLSTAGGTSVSLETGWVRSSGAVHRMLAGQALIVRRPAGHR